MESLAYLPGSPANIPQDYVTGPSSSSLAFYNPFPAVANLPSSSSSLPTFHFLLFLTT